jgi:hypothetical protein
MVASCKASKEAATEPAGATAAAAAAAAKRRVELGLGQAGERGVEGKTKAVVVVAKQQAARKRVPAMLAVVMRRCMRSCCRGRGAVVGGRFLGRRECGHQFSTTRRVFSLCSCGGLQF